MLFTSFEKSSSQENELLTPFQKDRVESGRICFTLKARTNDTIFFYLKLTLISGLYDITQYLFFSLSLIKKIIITLKNAILFYNKDVVIAKHFLDANNLATNISRLSKL